ncbi:hypothetical protein BP00DRAFT_421584 [Aspergillus indologenus CBS 114.80]|uniref:Uncharacterized protein n=1 Tax=Aspergillus indologenus CBS 114.80 TaxID=1450541 RepID=A0A2V5J2J9_9EURO|nr:hypothetical protein BP00DRAFT_421584 [Aspergillus indologenus CBS 114.80]
MGDVREIRALLDKKGEQSWGLFIYRACSYNDDSQWERFMERFKGFARERIQWFEETDGGEPILHRLEWNVQEDPALETCSMQDIWRRHRDLMRDRFGEYDGWHIRHAFPLIVTQEAMDSVLAAPTAAEWDPDDYKSHPAHLVLLDMAYYDDQEESEQTPQGGGEVEKFDPENVPFRKVFVRDVYPRLYSMLIDAEWDIMRPVPPGIVRMP